MSTRKETRRGLGVPTAPRNESLLNLGFRLAWAESSKDVHRLLKACDLDPVPEPAEVVDPTDPSDENVWEPTRYLVAKTRAGGLAACIGWNRSPQTLVLHSLAVAPSSRRNRVGVSLLASALGWAIDQQPVDRVFLITDLARSLFTSFGFEGLDRADVPDHVAGHPTFRDAHPDATAMVRRYRPTRRGLDQCAFRLIHNTTEEELLPKGSVFLFKQSGSLIEASYRGEPVRRGHLIGHIDESRLRFLWHQYVAEDKLLSGDGEMHVNTLDDGRRELREELGDHPGELLLREV